MDGDGTLSAEEIDDIHYIEIVGFEYDTPVASIQGIELFHALTELWVQDCALTEVDLSHNSMLERVNLYDNQLMTLDLSGNPRIKRLNLSKNRLTARDVTVLPALNVLDVSKNALTGLDLSGHTHLRELWALECGLTSIDVSGCSSLQGIYCNDNRLTKLELSGCRRLAIIYCSDNQLTALDVSDCFALRELRCRNNQMESLILGDSRIYRLEAQGNALTELDIRGCPVLMDYYLNGDCVEFEGACWYAEDVYLVDDEEGQWVHVNSDNPMVVDQDVRIIAAQAQAPTMGLSRSSCALYLTEGGFGGAYTLEATGDAELTSTAAWSTSDAGVVTVQGGRLAAVREGTAIVTASAGDLTASCQVTVTALETVVLPDSLSLLDAQAFSGAGSIQCVLVPDAAVEIGAGAFENCPALRLIRIPASVEHIADDAFAGAQQVRLSCPSGSEAARFASEHGLDHVIE